jgi:hypothetical protein
MIHHTLPAHLKPFFWDVDFEALDWETHQDFIVRRLLQSGSWDALRWLRAQIGDSSLCCWLEAHRGGGLLPRQLRFWQLVLGLRKYLVDEWVAAARDNPWSRRVQP